jgi:hypothetical protein
MSISEQQRSSGPKTVTSRRPRRWKAIPAERIEADLKACLPRLQPTPQEMYPYKLATGYGVLWICPCYGVIRTRFEEVPIDEPAGASLNKYSGKWNFEGLDDTARLVSAIFFIGRIAL